MQQPIHKVVGRPLTMSRRLAHLEDLAGFLKKHAQWIIRPSRGRLLPGSKKLLVALATDGIDFAVVGGLAVIFNGYPRLTLDADVLVHAAPKNLRKLLDCLANWGEGWGARTQAGRFHLRSRRDPRDGEFDLDIFTRMNGKSLDDFRPRLRYLETGGVRVPYLAPEDLIFLKQDSWRDKRQAGRAGHAGNHRARS